MIPFAPTGSGRLPPRQRFALALGGASLAGLLLIAALLSPSPSGLGTHEQLGLPPCTFKSLFDMRCPACGMTTAWAHAARGHIPRALSANVGGALLAGVAVAAVPWCLLAAAIGRWPLRPPRDTALAIAAVAIVLVTLADWAVRLSID